MRYEISNVCISDQSEKELLLELKNSLTYDPSLSTKLVKWNESIHYCQWIGLKCDDKGRVSDLDLSSESISGGINSSASNLFKLVHLRSLNLAQNSFDSIELPFGFGKLTDLRYLNLSNSGFSGQIPLDLSNLTRLVILDLSSTYYSSLKLENPNIEKLIHSYTKLRELYLDGVNISAKGYEWCNAVSSSLPNLQVLSLSNTYLTGPFDSSLLKLRFLSVIRLDGNTFSSTFPQFFTDFHNLSVLSLSSCNLSGVVPKKLFQIMSLHTVDLSGNRYLEGSLPEFHINGSLQNLLLSYTNFSGNLSESIGSLKMLSNVDLRGCGFSGLIPSSIKNLSRLIYLDLSQNRFIGSVPSFASLKNLQVINLHGNRLTGKVPGSSSRWKGLENLNFLDLSDNSIEGEVPSSLFLLPVLKVLYLSNNSFYGSLNVSSSSSPSSSLEVLQLSINNLEGQIPQFLFELKNLSSLSLAKNKFNGSVELTDLRKLTNLVNLDLSYNDISVHVHEKVPIFSLFPRLGCLMLASCKINKLPLLKNQSSLMMLDLSDNRLNGEIPSWIWEIGNGFLRFLNLSHNQFSFLQQPYNIRSLDFLDLHSNILSGQIPLPPPSAVFVDLSSNNFSSSLPFNIGNFLRRASFFSIANNGIVGNIPSSFCNASRIQTLDLSSNSLHGRMPSCLTENAFMTVLNLRRNNIGGRIPESIGNLQKLESLDLSLNNFGGQIPKRIVDLTFLSFLNLSYNHLVGRIPQGGRMQTFPVSSFAGNDGLCGSPLVNKSCSGFGASPFSQIRGRGAGKFRY